MERLTKCDNDGQAMMDCQKCEADWTGKHGKPKPDGFCAYRLRNDGADIGKTVFLTREEAKKALEAKKNE